MKRIIQVYVCLELETSDTEKLSYILQSIEDAVSNGLRQNENIFQKIIKSEVVKVEKYIEEND